MDGGLQAEEGKGVLGEEGWWAWSSSKVRSLRARPSSTSLRTSLPTTWWASRKGSPFSAR